MKSISAGATRDLFFLSLTAGSADAVGYMGFGRVFTSNMTGNVVLLGIDMGEGHLAAASRTVFVLAIFVLGVAAGALLGRNVRERDWPRLAARMIGLEKIALVLFAIGWAICAGTRNPLIDGLLLFLLTFALGLQSAAMNRLSAPGVSTTAITGTLTVLVTGLVELILPTSPKPEGTWDRIKFQSTMIVLYCCGAAASGYLVPHLRPVAGCLPALALLFVWPRIPRHS